MPKEKKLPTRALKIIDGVKQPSSINPEINKNLKNYKRKTLTAEDYISGILNGKRTILSQAITLIESNKPEHYSLAQEIIHKCLPYSGNSLRIGITGVPGVGKSTFIESFGLFLIEKGHKLAVLAIDPSSDRSGGSILGDKTRMEVLSNHDNAYIRPSPSSGSLGGVARKTRETIFLCEAAGFDVIFVETVGVGQSEIAVHSMVDFFLLLALAGAGDELQGIKRGIMEMADAIVITKADGSNFEKALKAQTEIQNALLLFPLPASGWKPKVLTCSALEKKGLSEIWEIIVNFINHTKNNSYFNEHRIEQSKFWLHQTIKEKLMYHFYHHPEITKKIQQLEQKILNGEITSFEAADQVLNWYVSKTH